MTTNKTLLNNYRSWRRYRRTYNQLMWLSPRELEDIGVNRIDIRSIARRSSDR